MNNDAIKQKTGGKRRGKNRHLQAYTVVCVDVFVFVFNAVSKHEDNTPNLIHLIGRMRYRMSYYSTSC